METTCRFEGGTWSCKWPGVKRAERLAVKRAVEDELERRSPPGGPGPVGLLHTLLETTDFLWIAERGRECRVQFRVVGFWQQHVVMLCLEGFLNVDEHLDNVLPDD